jgi:hypothetical protein
VREHARLSQKRRLNDSRLSPNSEKKHAVNVGDVVVISEVLVQGTSSQVIFHIDIHPNYEDVWACKLVISLSQWELSSTARYLEMSYFCCGCLSFLSLDLKGFSAESHDRPYSRCPLGRGVKDTNRCSPPMTGRHPMGNLSELVMAPR